ncbi:MAG: class I SAM-dependent methyltransferase [Flavobacterium sp.]|nr:MAG: class I SAM-dependent methyltransferase [Flavobacterium sp.]
MKDLFGKAILDYATQNSPEDLITETSISEADEMSVAYLFRPFDQMPALEQRALQESRGRVLDAGCGAGSHSLYLQAKGFDVTAIDISPNAIEACRLRGIKKAHLADIMQLENEKFDTILLLMNGAGMCGKLDNLGNFLQKLKSLLNPGGQVLLDSSDIIYMFDDDEDGGKWIPANGYYGNVIFYVTYKNEKENPFEWLYVDFQTLQNAALANGFQSELLQAGSHFDYLARLTV